MARKKHPRPAKPAAATASVSPLTWVLLGLIAYLALFFAYDMPGLHQRTGKVFPRITLLLMLQPQDLVDIWCGTPAEIGLVDRLPVLGLAGGIVLAGACLGWLLLTLLGLQRRLTRLESLVFSTAVGLGVVSTYVLAVGLAGGLASRWVFLGPGLGIVGSAAWRAWNGGLLRRRAKRQAAPMASSKRENSDDWLSPHWLWLAVPFTILILLGGMLPPMDFDVREYHLQAPKEFYQQGRIAFLPHNVYANMPLGAEMFSLLAMVVAGDWWLGALAGKTVIALFAPLTALGLLAAGRRFFSPVAGIVAAIVYLSIPWIVQVSTTGLVEGVLACYWFLAAYAVAMWWSHASLLSLPEGEGERSQLMLLLLAGYLAGAAMACKYPAVLFVVVPLTTWVCWALGRMPWHRVWKPLGAFLLAVALGCGLWLGKNWALSANPTYPLLYGLFGGKTWTAEKDAQWNRIHRPHDFSLPTLGKDLARVGITSEWLSPLVMPLAVLAFFRRRPQPLVLALGAYVLFVVAGWWLLTHRIDRFWVPALPLAALLAGVGATWASDLPWRRTLVGLLALGAAWNLLVAGSVGGGCSGALVRLERLRRDPDRLDPWHAYLNAHAAGGGVLLVGDAQPFDLDVPVVYSTCFDDSPLEQAVKGRGPEEIRDGLARLGVTHVYVHWGEVERYRNTYGFTEFIQPEVFDALVAQGILAPLPPIGDHPGRGYRVTASP